MKESLVFWFTGLSGSGKTTVAEAVKPLLEKAGYSVLILDGDDVRNRLHVNLGFSEEDIKMNNYLIIELCKKYRDKYDIIFVPVISPYIYSRKEAKRLLGKKCFEIYFSADLETVMKRDVKGLYTKAKNNEINNLIGYSPSNKYEPPQNPDFVISTGVDPAEISITHFHHYVLFQIKNYK